MAAARVAEERGERLGDAVGYRVRFDKKVSKRTRLEFLTEGMLTRRLLADPALPGVGAVVFDEVHERGLELDLGIARVADLRRRRPELRVVAMSATLEAAPLARFLGDAPVLSVPGRTFPVAIEHDPAPDDRPLERRVRAACVRLLKDGSEGDILCFLPGVAEIRRTMKELAGPARSFGVDVLPLYGDLKPEEQARAVRRGPRPKIVVSTNVAETSLTLEAVVAVVDAGLAKVASHSPFTGLSGLRTRPISQASATQRAGRAGRVREGRALRLYTKGDHDRRPLRDRPEIERADLASVVLGLRHAGEDPRTFSWFEAPPEPALAAAEDLLERLGAIDEGAVTERGRRLAHLPLHPRLGVLALEATARGHREAGAALAAVLAEGLPRGVGGRRVASSDLLMHLDALEGIGFRPGRAAGSGFTPGAVAAIARARRQLLDALPEAGEGGTFDEDHDLSLAVLAAFPDRVAERRRGRELVFAEGGGATLDPASVVGDARLLVAVDATVGRGRTRVHAASAIEAEDLVELFEDALEELREVRFDEGRGRVVAVSELRYGQLVLDRSESSPTPAEAAPVLARAALAAGLGTFGDAEAIEALQRRVAFARRFDDRIPALDDAGLEAVLVRLCEGKGSFAELKDAKLEVWVEAELGPHRAAVDRLAPTHVSLPGRARVPVRYEVDRDPWIASRLQDFFGSAEGPAVAGGRVPLLLHLLDPRGRAVQMTTDLAGFWARHYDEVRKELRRRYAKHHWPDDPATAEARRLQQRRRR
jgi:ATP-dependent helicase HrpB